MKRVLTAVVWCSLLLAALCMGAQAENSYLLEDDYAELVACYQSGVDYSSYQPKKAIEELREIVRIYEGNADLQYFMDAAEYYNYARGRIAVDEQEYAQAVGFFTYCSDTLYERNAYMMLAQGMQYMERADYEKAIHCLSEARQCREISSLANQTLQSCNTLYFQEVMAKGDAFCLAEDHAAALECYGLALELLPADETALTAYDACYQHLQEKNKAAEIVNVQVGKVSASAAELSWAGQDAQYYFAVDCRGRELNFESVSEETNPDVFQWTGENSALPLWLVQMDEAGAYSVKVEGLYPGTGYVGGVWALDGTVVAFFEFETAKANHHEEIQGRIHTLWRYDAAAAANTMRVMAEGTSLHAALYPKDKTHRIGDDATVNLTKTPLEIEGCYVNITLKQSEWPSEALAGKPYHVLLHTENATMGAVGTLPGNDIVLLGENRLCIVLDELFSTLKAQSAYIVDVLVDGKLVYQFSGNMI